MATQKATTQTVKASVKSAARKSTTTKASVKSAARKAATIKASVKKAATETKVDNIENFADATSAFKAVGQDVTSAFGDARKVAGSHVKALSSTALDLAQTNIDEGFEAMRATMGANDVKEAWEIQSAYAKSVWERTTSEGRKFFEIVGDLTRETSEPFANVAAKVKDRIAA